MWIGGKLHDCLRHKVVAPFIVIIGLIAGVAALWYKMKVWVIVLILIILLILIICALYECLTASVKFISEEKDAQEAVTHLLEKTNKSLYYYGGAGFIGDYQPWRDEFKRVQEDKEIKVVRLIDLKTPEKIADLLKGVKKEDEIKEEVKQYKKWLTHHSKNLEYRGANNEFYNFDGAPLWKYGVSHIIFDEKHVVITYLSKGGEKRNVIILRNRTDIAQGLMESIDWIVHKLNIESLSSEKLKEMCCDGGNS